ncbi:MAG: UTP--glucose-1-phosphate uridylyltransferase [Chloroflexi bacterium]|nr:UTP--glucose-1-phosphate uridylyltransferase [Chloroflexota bacterium]
MTHAQQNSHDLISAHMAAEGLPDIFIKTFVYYYGQLVQGQTGMIPEQVIEPVSSLPDAETFSSRYTEIGERLLPKTAVIKLNGGLGTSMGLQQAKSLLPIKQNMSFLDVIANQVMNASIPLLLMNSFNTEQDSLAALANYENLAKGNLPLSFVQHKEPKIQQSNLMPVSWPQNRELEWCPPGHGDIYTALVTSNVLDKLLNAGYEYAFVSNADNLGAVMDNAILGYFVEGRYPFMMEVADRTAMDRKGGHLARRRGDGQFVLRESAQCPPENTGDFQDITRHKYFNTNNLWLNLLVLKAVMKARDYTLGLPLICNNKTVDPRDTSSTAVYQLETAMGSAIAVFQGAQAIRVPRSRFAPVKTTNDLLAVRSDAYMLTDDYRVVQNPNANGLVVSLDPKVYKFVNAIDTHFPHGAPSLEGCAAFSVEGKFEFGRNIVCEGNVHLKNESDTPIAIPDGTVLSE